MEKKFHYSVYGVGPLCVYTMVAMFLAAIVLHYLGYLASGSVPKLQIPMCMVGVMLVGFGIYLWIRAVLVDRVGDEILSNHLLTTGVYAWVRNPIYSAVAIALTGAALLWHNLWMLVLPVLFWLDITVLMICTEEKWLQNLYGEKYSAYCRRVNRCIPWFPK